MRYPLHLLKLIESLKKLPGVGNKSAERFAFHLLNTESKHLDEMADTIKEIPNMLKICETCGSIKGIEDCSFCREERSNRGILCIVASPKDVFQIEDTGEFFGLYHVLGKLLSPMNGIGPEKIQFQKLKDRILKHQIKEIIIALDSTLEGDATSLYLKEELKTFPVHISRLAFGLPMGSSFDYVDGGTLARAFSGRGHF